MLTSEEKTCIENKTTFPELSENLLKRAKFYISKEEYNSLLDRIEKGYGMIVDLNNKFNLKLQYHGRFGSFLIGIGTNPQNPDQPDLKLVRIDSVVETTHNKKIAAFLESKRIEGPHFHWFNYFYPIFINQKIFNLENPNRSIYNKIIEVFLENNKNLNFNQQILEKAVPYKEFFDLCNLVIQQNRKLRIDGHITISSDLKKYPKSILNQILNKEIL